MAEELRLAFILLGSLAIGAVVLHGVWTVRKAVNEERKLNKREKVEEQELEDIVVDEEVQSLKLKQMEMDFNELQAQENGLPVVNVDVDSIYKTSDETHGDVQVETQEASVTEPASIPTGLTPQNELFAEPEEKSNEIKIETEFTADDDFEPKLGDFDDVDDGTETPVTSHHFNEPELTDPEPESQNEPKIGDMEQDQRDSQPEQPQQVLMLFVDKAEGEAIEGARLLPLLLTLGFKFGEMDFFHRHENNSGQGEILFSLANMFNPGTFDPDRMEQFSTRGLTIFMTLPNALEPLQTFNMMHNAAKKIADEFDAKVLDEQRRPLDVSIVRGYVERIRKFKG